MNAKARKALLAHEVFGQLAAAIEWHVATSDWDAFNSDDFTAEEIQAALEEHRQKFRAKAHENWNRFKREVHR
jgi:hypothetical protein